MSKSRFPQLDNIDPQHVAARDIYSLICAAQAEPGEWRMTAFVESQVSRVVKTAEQRLFEVKIGPKNSAGKIPISLRWNKGDAK